MLLLVSKPGKSNPGGWDPRLLQVEVRGSKGASQILPMRSIFWDVGLWQYRNIPKCTYPVQFKISHRRIKYLGQRLRHPLSLEFLISFNPSKSLRTITSAFRRGAPRARPPELALAETCYNIGTHRSNHLLLIHTVHYLPSQNCSNSPRV